MQDSTNFGTLPPSFFNGFTDYLDELTDVAERSTDVIPRGGLVWVTFTW